MKKTLKRLGALALALCLVLALGATALADGEANMTSEAGVIGEFTTTDTATTQATSVIIYKEITAYNPETRDANAPATTHNYTIGAGSAGKDIWDVKTAHNPEANVHVVTKAGVGTPTITGTAAGALALVPGTDKLNASENGTANRFPLTVSFDGIFKTGDVANYAAGVYRYVINETTTEATKNASGIKEGTVANTLYMDVYVDGSGNIYGYVLFTNDNSIDARDGATTNTVAEAGKTEGFVGNKPDDGVYDSEATSIADKYYTFNLEISKDVVNDTYIETTKHQFPFTVTLTNSTVTANVLPIMTVGANATQTALTAAPIAGTWMPTIADSAVIAYVGIPCGTTVKIKEMNNVDGTTYESKSENAGTTAAVKNIFTNEYSNEATVNCGETALAKATENHTATKSKQVLFTNTLKQISPTGVVIRVAPYVLILCAGVVLLVLSRRRKMADDEA